MPIDPAASAVDAVVAYFASVLGSSVSRVLRGWPEHGQDLKLGDGPVLAVTVAGDERTLLPPRNVDQAVQGDGLLVTYKIGTLRLSAQLDLWTQYRSQRDDVSALIEAAAHNRLPHQAGLFLDQSDYYSRPLNVNVGRGRTQDDPRGVSKGMWRRFWDLTIDTDVVVQATTAQLKQLDLQAALEEGATTISETVQVTS